MKTAAPIIVILVCALSYFFYLSPSYTEVMTLLNKRAEYQNILNKSQELKDKRDEILATYNSISEADIEKLDKVIPQKFSTVSFANEISALASRYNLSVTNIKTSQLGTDVGAATPQVLPYKTTVITVSIEGQFALFVKFLQDVESNLRILDVTSLSIRPSLKTGAGSALQYTLEVYTYSLQ